MKFSILLESVRQAILMTDSTYTRQRARKENSRVRGNMTRRQLSLPIPVTFVALVDVSRMQGRTNPTHLLAREFPHFKTLCNCSSVHASRSTDLTRLIWVPMPRWMPEQRMQMKMPRFHDAHRGSAGFDDELGFFYFLCVVL